MVNNNTPSRISSGMRVTGKMHLGHYHGALKNWAKLQYEYECFFFAADWHALTTHYDNPSVITENVWDMLIDWLGAGINPGSANIFIQSAVPEVAELHLLLSMCTPLSWLERIPTYKDQQENIQDKDLSTYGFLGYPMLQSADVLLYKANFVPVGEDQASHVELIREVARRFNFLYGREPHFEENAENSIAKMGKKHAKLYTESRKAYQETGDEEALARAKALLDTQQQLSYGDRERLLGYLVGISKTILPEPQILLTETSKLVGLDGRKMSKSYNNTISLREKPAEIEKKIRTMPTDPARIKRSDAGEPEKCPVWSLHKVYSDDGTKKWVQTGCRSAGIGCLECKQPIIDAVQKEVSEIRERAKEYEENPQLVKHIVAQGTEKARDVAQETLKEVKETMGLS
ncbi:MAG: tryptophan--tRNA ligase [Gammaproteobacteria bacterium]|nr:tryptophan--tRNA ligase [Gammaproteobacteria bacterium]